MKNQTTSKTLKPPKKFILIDSIPKGRESITQSQNLNHIQRRTNEEIRSNSFDGNTGYSG